MLKEGFPPGLSVAITENTLYLECIEELYLVFSVILPLSLDMEKFEVCNSWYVTVPNVPESISVAFKELETSKSSAQV